jgi:hypothetical protein
MSHKYLIERLWIDPMENRNADGYEPFGYVDTEEEAKEECSKGRMYNEKDCWSLFADTPQYRYRELKHLTNRK